MHDANDVESMDDDEGFYSDEMGMDYYGSDDDVDVDFGEDNEGIKRIEASRAEVCPTTSLSVLMSSQNL